MKKIKIDVEGTHCVGCKARIEGTVGALKGVCQVDVDYASGKSSVEFDESQVSRRAIVEAIEHLGYQVRQQGSAQRVVQSSSKSALIQRFLVGGLLLCLISVGYVVVERSGGLALLARLNEGNLGLGLVFLIGLLASFHCVGMCGGLVVAYSAGQTREGQPSRSLWPHLQYNLGRVVSYSLIGAILGGFGSFFGISPTFTGVLTLAVGLVMLLMGVSLLSEGRLLSGLHWQPLARLGRFFFGQQGSSRSRGPLVLGLLNGFMPCGPLQAMQLYALGTGSMVRGGLSMAMYALGTVPLMFGFGSILSFLSQARVRQMLKLSGAIVVLLGLMMLGRGVAGLRVGLDSSRAQTGLSGSSPATVSVGSAPVVTPSAAQLTAVPAVSDVQTVRMAVTYQGYVPNTLQVKKDVPVRWVIEAKEISRCTNEIVLHDYNISQKLKQGQEYVIEFTPTHTGVIRFSCWMQMVWGKFVVS